MYQSNYNTNLVKSKQFCINQTKTHKPNIDQSTKIRRNIIYTFINKTLLNPNIKQLTQKQQSN